MPSFELNARDDDLVARVRAGDVEAFTTIFRAAYVPLVQFAHRYVLAQDLAEEIVSEVFANVWARRTVWAPRQGIVAYCFGAVYNRAVSATKRAQRERAWRDGDPPMLDVPADAALDEASDATALAQAIARLPERLRTVLELRWTQQMSYDQIADVMQTSVAAVQKQHSRAIQALRDLLPDYLD